MAERTCTHCGGAKPASDFYVRQLAHGEGLTGECKSCRCARSRQHYADNTEQHAATVARRYRTHFRFARYGLTAESFAAMLAQQHDKCALCGTPEPGGKGEWHVDHEGGTDQSKGWYQCVASQVRGLLCHRCNVSLGHLEKLNARVGADVLARYLTRTTP